MTPQKTIVMTVKMKNGTNLLGFYFGEEENTEDPRIILYRPIIIKLVTYSLHGKTVNAYVTDQYFQYGSGMVSIPYSEIFHQDIASEFFTSFYIRSASDLSMMEEELHDSYTRFFLAADIKVVLENTDSIYIDTKSEYTQ